MAGELEIRGPGVRALPALIRAMEKAAGVEVRKEIRKAVAAEVQPLRVAEKESARARLPHRGGYNRVIVRRLSVRSSVRTSGEQISVNVVLSAKGKTQNRDLASLDRGRLRHPLFGRRRSRHTGRSLMFNTAIRPGTFSDPVQQLKPEIREKILEALDRVARNVAQKAI